MTKKRLGLVLSGGGARGIAHIGVIRALQEHGIEADLIAGTSAGAIVGALYAAGHSPDSMLDFVRDASIWRIFKVGLPTDGLTKLTYLRERLAQFITQNDFAALQKPLHIAVTNLNTGKLEIKDSGPLFEAVMASSSIPLVFKPVEFDGQVYVDGGLLNNLPVAPIAEHCTHIIGVNVMPNLEVQNKAVQSVFGIATRCFELSIYANTLPSARDCDWLIEPKELYRYNIFQFNKYREIHDLGYEEAIAQVEQIKAALSQKGIHEKEKN